MKTQRTKRSLGRATLGLTLAGLTGIHSGCSGTDSTDLDAEAWGMTESGNGPGAEEEAWEPTLGQGAQALSIAAEKAIVPVGMAIAKGSDVVYAWHANGMLTMGTHRDLDRRLGPTPFSLPSMYRPGDIIDMDFNPRGELVTWLRDGYRIVGTPEDLDSLKGRERYALPPGYSYAELNAVAISTNNQTVAWYADGRASKGSTKDFDSVRAPYRFTGIGSGTLLGAAISSENHVYGWTSDGRVREGSSEDLDAHAAAVSWTGIQAGNPNAGPISGASCVLGCLITCHIFDNDCSWCGVCAIAGAIPGIP